MALSERCLGREGQPAAQTINTKGWNIPLLIKIYGGDQVCPGIFTAGKTQQLRLVEPRGAVYSNKSTFSTFQVKKSDAVFFGMISK